MADDKVLSISLTADIAELEAGMKAAVESVRGAVRQIRAEIRQANLDLQVAPAGALPDLRAERDLMRRNAAIVESEGLRMEAQWNRLKERIDAIGQSWRQLQSNLATARINPQLFPPGYLEEAKTQILETEAELWGFIKQGQPLLGKSQVFEQFARQTAEAPRRPAVFPAQALAEVTGTAAAPEAVVAEQVATTRPRLRDERGRFVRTAAEAPPAAPPPPPPPIVPPPPPPPDEPPDERTRLRRATIAAYGGYGETYRARGEAAGAARVAEADLQALAAQTDDTKLLTDAQQRLADAKQRVANLDRQLVAAEGQLTQAQRAEAEYVQANVRDSAALGRAQQDVAAQTQAAAEQTKKSLAERKSDMETAIAAEESAWNRYQQATPRSDSGDRLYEQHQTALRAKRDAVRAYQQAVQEASDTETAADAAAQAGAEQTAAVESNAAQTAGEARTRSAQRAAQEETRWLRESGLAVMAGYADQEAAAQAAYDVEIQGSQMAAQATGQEIQSNAVLAARKRELQSQMRIAVKEQRDAQVSLQQLTELNARNTAQQTTAAKELMDFYTAAADKAIAKQAELGAAIGEVEAQMRQATGGAFRNWGIVEAEVGAATGSMGRFEYGLMRILAQTRTLGPLMEIAFTPLLVAGLAEVVGSLIEKIHTYYQDLVELKTLTENVEQAQLALASATQRAVEQEQRLMIAKLRREGADVEAARKEAEFASQKPFEQPQFAEKKVEKNFGGVFSGFSDEQKKFLEGYAYIPAGQGADPLAPLREGLRRAQEEYQKTIAQIHALQTEQKAADVQMQHAQADEIQGLLESEAIRQHKIDLLQRFSDLLAKSSVSKETGQPIPGLIATLQEQIKASEMGVAAGHADVLGQIGAEILKETQASAERVRAESAMGSISLPAAPAAAGVTSFSPVGAIPDMIREQARRSGVPEAIALAVAAQESGFRQYGAGGKTLTSNKGALGVMQLEPGTAAEMGVNPNDTAQNIKGGIAYLEKLFQKYQNWGKALAAYNTGEGNVDKGVIPPETLQYVSAVLQRAQTPAPAITGGSGRESNTILQQIQLYQDALAKMRQAGVSELTQPFRQAQAEITNLQTQLRSKTVQDLRNRDEEELNERRRTHTVTLSEERAFWENKLTQEAQYRDRVVAIHKTLADLESKDAAMQERRRTQQERLGSEALTKPEGGADFGAQLDYWNNVIADVRNRAIAEVQKFQPGLTGSAFEEAVRERLEASNEYANAEMQAGRVGAEAVRQASRELVKAEDDGLTALKEKHRVDVNEEVIYWAEQASIAERGGAAAKDALDHANAKLADAEQQLIEQQRHIQRTLLEISQIAAQGNLKLQESVVKEAPSLGMTPEQLGKLTGTPIAPEKMPSAGQTLGTLGAAASPAAMQAREEMSLHKQVYDDLVRTLAQEQAKYKQGSAQFEDIEKQKTQAAQRYNQQRLQDEIKVIQTEEQYWRKLYQDMSHIFFQNLNEWISGQKRFSQAMIQGWNSMVMSVIQDIEKMAAKWIEEHLIMAAVAKLLQALGLDTGSQAGGQQQQIQTNQNVAESYVDLAAAIAFEKEMEASGNVWAAIAMGLVARAAGEVIKAPIAAYDIGGIVPEDQIALVHRQEAVLPAAMTQLLMNAATDHRSAGLAHPGAFAGAGGSMVTAQQMSTSFANSHSSTLHYSPTIHAGTNLSGGEFAKMLDRHADHVGRIMNRQARQFNR